MPRCVVREAVLVLTAACMSAAMRPGATLCLPSLSSCLSPPHQPQADPHPGNVAVDAAGGGRLVYYDFGMMGSIREGIRGGLMVRIPHDDDDGW